tara:strand:- start:1877 stop:2200 length:324 start_codon:yes stop_codon:yes gene_type:complete
MRMWMVRPELLCRKHLLGEHVELHMLVGTINKGTSVGGYVKGGLVEVHNVKSRHTQLVTEMTKRGYNHQSPLPKFNSFAAGVVSVKDNVKELKKRCTDCRERIKNNS